MKNVTFNLGPTVGLDTRVLVITRHMRAGDDAPVSPYHNADAGAVASVVVALPDNQIWSAVLTDTMTAGEVRPPQLLNFHTGELQYLGPRASVGGEFYILHMEDLSSSSSSSVSSESSLSSSSLSSSSSHSSSSLSSSSSHSSSSASSGSSQSASSQS
jgi:hypothetical protein